MKLTIEIDSENDAVQNTGDLADILEKACMHLRDPRPAGSYRETMPLRDINGNVVGQMVVTQ